jgi:hypothetical protein
MEGHSIRQQITFPHGHPLRLTAGTLCNTGLR